MKIAPVELEFEDGEPMKLTVTGDSVSLYERVQAANPTSEELETYAGTYRSDELEIPYRLRVDENMLVLHRMKAEPESLRATMKDVFLSDGGTVRFERDESGDVSGFLLTTGRIRNLEFRRQSPVERQAQAK